MKLLIAGDFCPKEVVAELFEKEQFADVLGNVMPYTKAADYSIVNFECAMVKGGETPIAKCGPSHCCTRKSVDALKYAGFDCVTLANNHFSDFGNESVSYALEQFDESGIAHVGGGCNIDEAQKVLYVEANGEKLAVVNFCEHEFSIASATKGGSAPLDMVENYRQITEARKNADYVLVIVHGGNEHYQLPSPRMKKTYRWFIDIGADVVVNHHQHCYSGYEVYNGKFIFYGLGNFCFEKPKQMPEKWYEGYIVQLDFSKQSSFELMPYIQCKYSSAVVLMDDEQTDMFYKKIEAINSVISDDIKLKDEFVKFCESKRTSQESLFVFYRSKVAKWMAARGIWDKTLPESHKLGVYNHVACESHLDVLLNFLANKK